MASTVILGSGIIGLSTALYLSRLEHDPLIHLVDASPALFASASGHAGGFLARDWFPPSAAALGALSYEEHRRLAEAEGGREKWGYTRSVTVSYEPHGPTPGGRRGEDWLLEGTSRVGLVRDRAGRDGPAPAWLRRADGDAVTVVDDGDGTALVDPPRLCQFLLDSCKAAGVRVHHPATALSVGTDASGELASVRIRFAGSQAEVDVAATRLLLSAGCWTPRLFACLFPASALEIPVASLGGHSLIVQAPGGADPACHSVYCSLGSLSPEMYARPDGVVYLAGVNSAALPLPGRATEAAPVPESVAELRRIAQRLMAGDAEPQVVRAALCFRPVTPRGTPVVVRLADDQLGGGVRTRPGAGGGVYVATGHGPWGIALSLGTGMVVAEMMTGRPTSADISGLGL